MKILFITDNFPPEVNAPATRTYEHCKHWIKLGLDVTVLTCAPNFPIGKVYEGYKNKLYQKEMIDGIKVIRVWSYMAPNKGFLKRIFDYTSFSLTAFLFGIWIPTDLIIATSPQLFSAVCGKNLSFFKRKKWIMEVRDLWPESILSVGAITGKNIFYHYLERIEKKLYRSAWRIVSVTDSFKENIISKGIDPSKIIIIKNGADLSKFRPGPKNQKLLAELKLNQKFIFGYIGTHGMAHKLDFIIKSILEIKDKDIHFIFIGAGAEKENVVSLARKLNLQNVTFINPVPSDSIPVYISIIDCMLVPLRKADLFKTVIPSKIFESAAMEKPILLGVEGESKKIIEQFKAGISFEPENKVDFLQKLHDIKTNIEDYKPGCRKLAKEFDREKLAKQFYHVLINDQC